METVKGEKIMIIFCGIVIVIASVMIYKSTYGVYKHNRLHEHWETRIVKTETGKFQVQCWQHDSADWYCEDPMGWYAIDNFGFNGKSDYDNLDEALKAKEEYDKKAFEWVHRDNVAEVVVGAKE